MSVMKLVSNVKSLAKATVSGKITWSEYCKPGNHDHKFGPTIGEYLAQIPLVCIVTAPIVILAWILYYGGIFTVAYLESLPEIVKAKFGRESK